MNGRLCGQIQLCFTEPTVRADPGIHVELTTLDARRTAIVPSQWNFISEQSAGIDQAKHMIPKAQARWVRGADVSCNITNRFVL